MTEKKTEEFTARRLRHAMAEEHITQQELAEKLDIQQSTISTWVNGQKKPTGLYRHIILSWIEKVEAGDDN